MSMYILEFDYCAVLILSIMVLSVIFRGMTKGLSDRLFLLILILSIANTLADILSVSVPDDLGKMVFYTIYYEIRVISLPCYLLYLISLSDGWHHYRPLWRKILFLTPVVVATVFVFFTPKYHLLISISNGVKTDEAFKFILYLEAGIYLLVATAYLINYRSFFRRNKIYLIMVVIPVTAIAIIIQIIYEYILLELFLQTAFLLFYFLTVQKPEERLYGNTGMLQRFSFQEDMRLIGFNKKSTSLCIFKIRNFATGIEPYNYEVAQGLVELVFQRIKNTTHTEAPYATIYYLSNGCFAVALRNADRDKAFELAKSIENALSEDRVRKEALNIKVEFYECILNLPTDVAEYTELQMLIDNIYDFLPGTDKIYEMKDINKNKKYRLITEIDSIVEKALKYKEFEVYLQPIYSVHRKRVAGAEAFLQLKHQDFGYIKPELLIESAERIGVVQRLGLFVYEEVCGFISSGTFKNIGIDFIGVSISLEQLKDIRFSEKFMNLTSQYGIEPSKIDFEIPKMTIEKNWNEVINQIKTIDECGFGMVIDQFGVGNTDFRKLLSLPIESVKLDDEVIQSMSSKDATVVVETTINMLKRLGRRVVAKGVSSKEQAENLIEIGCDYLQGDYFAEALSQERFVEYVVREGSNVI